MNKLNGMVLAAALTLQIFAVGCGGGRQVYVWGPGETVYYAQWEHDTHHDHVEWEQRNAADQRAYWQWRRHHRN